MSEKIHDLTLLYLRNQDLSALSPEELFDKYKEIYDKIKTYQKSCKESNVSVLK